jgi:hypothetical protein
VGGGDENVASIVFNQIRFSSLSNVENVHLESSNVTLLNVVDVSQLAVEAQAMAWKPHSCMLGICWGCFVVNNGPPMDLMNLQMLWCIIRRSEQATNDVLIQKCIMRKGLIKYIKVNGITPMITYV